MRDKTDIYARAGGAWRSLSNAKIWMNGAWRDFGSGSAGTAIRAEGDWNRIGRVVATLAIFGFNGDTPGGPRNRQLNFRIGANFRQTNMEHTWGGIPNADVMVLNFLYPDEIFGHSVTIEATTYFVTQTPSDEQVVLTMIDYPASCWQTETFDSFVEISTLARLSLSPKISIDKEPARQVVIDATSLFPPLSTSTPKQLALYCSYVSANSLTNSFHGGGLTYNGFFVDGVRYL
jgi:hypothetical protein